MTKSMESKICRIRDFYKLSKICFQVMMMIIIIIIFVNIPAVMKTGSGVNLNFLCNFSQLLLSNISLFTVLFTADVGFFSFLACFLVRDLFSSGRRHNHRLPPPPPHQPRPAPRFFVPTHNSFSNTSDTELFEISARLKLVSVPFGGLLLDIVQW